MPVIGNSRKHYSELVKQTSKIEYEGAGNYHYARVSVGTIGGGQTLMLTLWALQ